MAHSRRHFRERKECDCIVLFAVLQPPFRDCAMRTFIYTFERINKKTHTHTILLCQGFFRWRNNRFFFFKYSTVFLFVFLKKRDRFRVGNYSQFHAGRAALLMAVRRGNVVCCLLTVSGVTLGLFLSWFYGRRRRLSLLFPWPAKWRWNTEIRNRQVQERREEKKEGRRDDEIKATWPSN